MGRSNSSNSSATSGKGNTKPSQIAPAVKWCFTLHSYTLSDIESFNSSKSSKFIIFSEETGSKGETPHLQGYIEFNKKVRPVGMFENKTIHWEKAKGNREQNISYITKEGGRYWINGTEVKPLKPNRS